MNTPFEKRVCYTLCVCELTAVLSCVSIFYLTFAVYLPSYRQLNAGFSEETVMCTTQSNVTLENCELTPGVPSWSSCGEWCLSKSGGSCTQIRVDVRKNGSNIMLKGCETDLEDVVYCDGVDPRQPTHECITGQCAHLTGLYNCSLAPVSPGVTEAAYSARCRDMSTVLSCNLTSTDPGVQCKTKKACLHLNGLYLCRKGMCSRVRPPFKCEKKCTGIKTDNKSIIIRENDVIFTAFCKTAVDMETNEEVWPRDLLGDIISSDEIGSDSTSGNATTSTRLAEIREPPLLVMYCTNILDRQQNMTEIRMLDCFNGTLMEPNFFGETTDIIKLVKAHTENTRMLDPTKIIAPIEEELRLVHNAPLYINYEGCVNTLILRECETFYAQYGVDGSDLRSNARFPCYFRPNFTDDTVDSNFVILRLDMKRTSMELLICTVVPIVLAIISCSLLVICSKLVKIDDDSHFYLQFCDKTYKPEIEPPVKPKNSKI